MFGNMETVFFERKNDMKWPKFPPAETDPLISHVTCPIHCCTLNSLFMCQGVPHELSQFPGAKNWLSFNLNLKVKIKEMLMRLF